jgi:hypothetical protein
MERFIFGHRWENLNIPKGKFGNLFGVKVYREISSLNISTTGTTVGKLKN